MHRDEPGQTLLVESEEADSAGSLLRAAVDISEPSMTLPLVGLMPGDVLADRFVVERLVGSGGMGTIHCGTDLLTRERVAIKVMASGRVGEANRFAQEAAVLAELSHPAIVRYVAHGQTPEGAQFLAMEWLEGEDLSERLVRAPLTVEESLAVLCRACAGIAVAHARGIVHRDLKPSNLFLLNRDAACAKVLDFGIARHGGGTTLTQSGSMLGTVGYMSPEQAMGPRDVDARADVFALGCVLFECLTGRAAFVGPNAVAVLAKVLREEPPLVTELRPGVSKALAALVARMLAKNPEARPKDAAAVLSAVDALEQTRESAPPAARRAEGLTETEQRIVSVVLAAPRPSPAQRSEPTPEQLEAEISRIQALASRFGAEPVAMRGGGLLVVLAGRGAATDQACQAARYALELAQLRPDLCVGVATGRAETSSGRVPVGAAIDRAAELMVGAIESEAGIAIDALTAGLLEPSFDVRREGASFVLVGQRPDLEATRFLMGKPTPFVGRDKELGLLDLTLRECVDDRVARAVLVTGPPGQGKSRLRHEFVKKVRESGNVKVLIARGDPIGAGSAFTLVQQLVRHGTGQREGASAIERYAKLRAYVAAICKASDPARVAGFLGELIDAPSTEPGLELRAARDDPQIMSAWLRRSFGEWIEAECADKPLLIVLEDLQWGGLPSLHYLGDALAKQPAQPLMVLALARPEVHETFPNLWSGAEKIEVPLGRLTQRAAERLVRDVLGHELSVDTVSRITQRAAGNAFFLEELIRRAAKGDDQELPETVLALVQSRLERLEPETRRFVRAASIFGETFWSGGVGALVGPRGLHESADARLESLEVAEVVTVAPASRFPGEREYRFRHSFLREAAYAMLTDADKAAGHRVAGEWLEQVGEKGALTLADHFELGGDPRRAVSWLLRAAGSADDGGNFEAMVALRDRAVRQGAEDTERGLLGRMHAMALHQRGDLQGAVAVGREAMALLDVGSPDWLRCAAGLFSAGAFLGDESVTGPVLQAILSAPLPPELSATYGWAVCNACIGLMAIGELALAGSFLERAESQERSASSDAELRGSLRHFGDPAFVSGLRIARAYLLLVRGDLGGVFRRVSEARVLADPIMFESSRASCRLLLAAAYAETGSLVRAEVAARKLLSLSEPLGMHFYSGRSNGVLATAKLNAGRTAEAIALLLPLIDRRDGQLAVTSRALLAHALLTAGDLDGAVGQARAAIERGPRFPVAQAAALGALALVALRRGDSAAGLALAERGLDAAARGAFPRDGSVLHLARSEALYLLGRKEEARSAIREAKDRIVRIASTLDDPELRGSYVTQIAANARTLELADAWLD